MKLVPRCEQCGKHILDAREARPVTVDYAADEFPNRGAPLIMVHESCRAVFNREHMYYEEGEETNDRCFRDPFVTEDEWRAHVQPGEQSVVRLAAAILRWALSPRLVETRRTLGELEALAQLAESVSSQGSPKP